MKRILLGFAITLGLLTAQAAPVPAQDAADPAERVLGEPSAPVTIIEYSSLTCPHCAAFHADTLPRIKEQFIDTGKAKLVFRDFPFDRAGLTAAVLARCVPQGRFFGFIDVLFRSQAEWARAQDPTEALMRLAQFAGLPRAKAEQCLEDKALVEGILERRVEAEQKYGFNSTPSFVIDGTTLVGNQPFAKFRDAIEAALADKS